MISKTISVIGGLDYDLIMVANRVPGPGESLMANTYLEALGGKGANCAIATYRSCHGRPEQDESDTEPRTASPNGTLDIRVKMIGAVGDDRYGARFYEELRKSGLNTSGIVTVPDMQTSICFVMVEETTRQNRCLFVQGATGMWRPKHFYRPEDLGSGMIPDLCIAQMEMDKEVIEAIIETAGRAGIDFVLNAAPASPSSTRTYQWITHLIVNESQAAVLSGRDVNQVNEDTWETVCLDFLGRGVRNVVITLGSRGAYYANAESKGRCPAYEVDVVDTTGAGDTFTGAYSSEYLMQKVAGRWDIGQAVSRANKAAALAVTKMGAQSGIPWSDGIDDFVSRRVD
ncbi:hypothetical protein KVT40_008900 [Elsinoe batatas]|uniref:Ribokinase n=1 Tax=Elsinoe batatas TaxID=2601811 RepID=A0A8K0PFU9_9PEZI|nr:hypothetical protein KVT40_008900 [Elsinoe batatas]